MKKDVNICERCGKSTTETELCNSCKSQLTSLYNESISWETAYEIEQVEKEINNFFGVVFIGMAIFLI